MNIHQDFGGLNSSLIFADRDGFIFRKNPCSRGPIPLVDFGKRHIPYFPVEKAFYRFWRVYLKVGISHN